jgi:pyruvate,water dikinase
MLVPLEEATLETCGGKAAGLRLLLEQGFPVPPGLCVPFEVYERALPAELPCPAAGDDLTRVAALCHPLAQALRCWEPSAALYAALERGAQETGFPLAVRSSATCESRAGISSSGVFSSTTSVHDLPGLLEAIRRTWLSLWEIPSWATLGRGGLHPGEEAMAVIIQRQVTAQWAGLVLSRDSPRGGRLRIEAVPGHGAALAEGTRDPHLLLLERQGPIATRASFLPIAAVDFLRRAALLLEDILRSPVEVEWVMGEGQLWLVQVRPAALPPPAPPLAGWRPPEGDATLWRWDREHNPEPLSPAHDSLMALLDERSDGPPAHLVRQGYLYSALRTEEEELSRCTDLATAWGTIEAEALCLLGRREGAEGSAETASPLEQLEAALTFFCSFSQAYSGLSAARRMAIYRMHRFLEEHLPGLDPAKETLLSVPEGHTALARAEEMWRLAQLVRDDPALQQWLERAPLVLDDTPNPAFLDLLRQHLLTFGAVPRAWDVASPPLEEEPGRLAPRLLSLSRLRTSPREAHQHQVLRAEALAVTLERRLAPAAREPFRALLGEARLARRVAEDDDLLFARALRLVRRALLRGGAHLVARSRLDAPEEIFILPLTRTLSALHGAAPEEPLGHEVERNRKEWERQRRLVPPLTLCGETLTWPPPPQGPVLRGQGTGGLRRGPVHLVQRLEDLLGEEVAGAVVVCPTLLPSLAVVLPEIAALVTDHGGLLSHAACLAREMGVTAVVGTGSATRELREGEMVWVDGERGLVVREP